MEILFDTLLVTTMCLQAGSRVTSPMHPVQRQRARAQAQVLLRAFEELWKGPGWEKICDAHLPVVLRRYGEAIKHVTGLVENTFLRELVSPSVVNALEQGLATIELPAMHDHYDVGAARGQLAAARDGLRNLKTKVHPPPA